MTNMTCIDCGEIHSREEITRWMEENKNFTFRKDGNLICPNCIKKLHKKPMEQQIRELLCRSIEN